MPSQYYRTSEIARAVGVHPNTVRLYEQWGFLPPAPRTPSGYRKFSAAHLDQMKLARLAMNFTWLGGEVRDTARAIIFRGAAGDLGGALERAYHLRVLVQSERAQAEAAAEFLEHWAQGAAADTTMHVLWIGGAARLLGTTTDRLRNWERNGLIRVPRDPGNGYRLYGAPEIGRLRVIRALTAARYSLMAILRMLIRLDQGETGSLRQALDTPRPDEDAYFTTDRWLTTLTDLHGLAEAVIAHLREMIRKAQA
jgi:DNA-binding transcriptional MerR regulator